MKNCDIVKDLLPLYADDVCSEESRKAVEEHISGCSDCKAELEKLRKNVPVSPQKDGEVLKRIKRRLRIEKLVVGGISAVVFVFLLLGTLFFLINTDKSMDVEKYNIPDNLHVTMHGTELYLVVNGEAAGFWYVFPTISDTDGDHMGYGTGFDSEKKNGYGITLKQRKIDSFSITRMSNQKTGCEIMLFDIEKSAKMDKFFYYDDVNDKEYILWERDKND
ncbi:MAG: zf-HC2 domain-containing protein [Ruminococcus sp.]|uniref:zf-HC2 domain-containing protein n=1 Tax=Ruminococcus sp. TaxID=41978 RepID=UPI0025D2FCD2|nr:zf-HC2 domain-containing protein [Ruminococcus sp.]MBR5683525.1 zf-HC2 domain-containing protein [Ruminococcus sp.]